MSRFWHICYLAIIAGLVASVVQLYTAGVDVTQFQSALIRKTDNYSNILWLGKPIWQPILDLWTLQETIFEVKPELLIECGTYKGGSSYFFAQLFDLMGHGRVITVDIEKLHDLSHPRVTYLIGDCASQDIVRQIRAEAERVTGSVMVVLDSDHSQSHVMKELEAYQGVVTRGSYLHVQDGVIDILPLFARQRPGPLRAVEQFLNNHAEFEVDQERSERFLITHHPKGWLRRKN
jgi:cephalosporin hydroxylase